MALITRPYTYTAGTVIDPAQVTSNETTLYNDYNGNIDADNISSLAENVIVFAASRRPRPRPRPLGRRGRGADPARPGHEHRRGVEPDDPDRRQRLSHHGLDGRGGALDAQQRRHRVPPFPGGSHADAQRDEPRSE